MPLTQSTNINTSFEILRSRLDDPEFLACRGLGNEVPFHVLPYSATDELQMRELLATLLNDAATGSIKARVIHFDLWDCIVGISENRKLITKFADFELKRGSATLLDRLQNIAAPAKLVEYMHQEALKQYGEIEAGSDVLLITGIGKAYPIVRAHQILECAQPVFAHIPLVLLYPGIYDGQSLRLFNSINDGNYYRAFNLI